MCVITFFALSGDGFGGLAAGVALLQRQNARTLIGRRVAFGPGSFVVATGCRPNYRFQQHGKRKISVMDNQIQVY